jgi:hypothetical protein
MTYSHRQCTAANLGGASAAECNPSQTNDIAVANTTRGWAEDLPYMPPVIWIPFSPFRSISQPHYLNHGPYKGHWLLGDVNGHGVGRLLVEDVDNLGRYQASFTLFSGGALNTFGITGSNNRAYRAINRWATSPDSAIYMGSIYRRDGNWSAGETAPVVRLTFKDTTVFEILAMRSRKNVAGTANGVEIEFTAPVDPSTITTAAFSLQQYNYGMGAIYGTNSTVYSTKTPTVNSVSVSEDGRRVFVGIATPDTSIGASHFGIYGVGNNTPGVWVGPGDQDRTLRVTMGTGVRSSTGSSLYYNIAWLGWHFQSNQHFNPTTVSIAPALRAEIDRLSQALSARVMGGTFDVSVSLPGETSVSIYSLTGEVKAVQAGATGSFQFNMHAFDRGVHVLRVQQGHAVVSRRVTL